MSGKTVQVDMTADLSRPETHKYILIQYDGFIVTRSMAADFFPFGAGRYSVETVELFKESYNKNVR